MVVLKVIVLKMVADEIAHYMYVCKDALPHQEK